MKIKYIIDKNGNLKLITSDEYKALNLAPKYMLVDTESKIPYFYQNEKSLINIERICGGIPCDDSMKIVRDYMLNCNIFNKNIHKAHIFNLPYMIFFKMFNQIKKRYKFVNCSEWLKTQESEVSL